MAPPAAAVGLIVTLIFVVSGEAPMVAEAARDACSSRLSQFPHIATERNPQGDAAPTEAKGDADAGAAYGSRENDGVDGDYAAPLFQWDVGAKYTFDMELKQWMAQERYGSRAFRPWAPPVSPENHGLMCRVSFEVIAREACPHWACADPWEAGAGDAPSDDPLGYLLEGRVLTCSLTSSRFGGAYIRRPPGTGGADDPEEQKTPFYATLLDTGVVRRLYFHGNETRTSVLFKRGMGALLSMKLPSSALVDDHARSLLSSGDEDGLDGADDLFYGDIDPAFFNEPFEELADDDAVLTTHAVDDDEFGQYNAQYALRYAPDDQGSCALQLRRDVDSNRLLRSVETEHRARRLHGQTHTMPTDHLSYRHERTSVLSADENGVLKSVLLRGMFGVEPGNAEFPEPNVFATDSGERNSDLMGARTTSDRTDATFGTTGSSMEIATLTFLEVSLQRVSIEMVAPPHPSGIHGRKLTLEAETRRDHAPEEDEHGPPGLSGRGGINGHGAVVGGRRLLEGKHVLFAAGLAHDIESAAASTANSQPLQDLIQDGEGGAMGHLVNCLQAGADELASAMEQAEALAETDPEAARSARLRMKDHSTRAQCVADVARFIKSGVKAADEVVAALETGKYALRDDDVELVEGQEYEPEPIEWRPLPAEASRSLLCVAASVIGPDIGFLECNDKLLPDGDCDFEGRVQTLLAARLRGVSVGGMTPPLPAASEHDSFYHIVKALSFVSKPRHELFEAVFDQLEARAGVSGDVSQLLLLLGTLASRLPEEDPLHETVATFLFDHADAVLAAGAEVDERFARHRRAAEREWASMPWELQEQWLGTSRAWHPLAMQEAWTHALPGDREVWVNATIDGMARQLAGDSGEFGDTLDDVLLNRDTGKSVNPHADAVGELLVAHATLERYAVQALANLANPRGASRVLSLARHRRSSIRAAAVHALRAFHRSTEARRLLLDVVGDPYEDVLIRTSAVEALSAWPDHAIGAGADGAAPTSDEHEDAWDGDHRDHPDAVLLTLLEHLGHNHERDWKREAEECAAKCQHRAQKRCQAECSKAHGQRLAMEMTVADTLKSRFVSSDQSRELETADAGVVVSRRVHPRRLKAVHRLGARRLGEKLEKLERELANTKFELYLGFDMGELCASVV